MTLSQLDIDYERLAARQAAFGPALEGLSSFTSDRYLVSGEHALSGAAGRYALAALGYTPPVHRASRHVGSDRRKAMSEAAKAGWAVRRAAEPKPCECGCGATVTAIGFRYLPGHSMTPEAAARARESNRRRMRADGSRGGRRHGASVTGTRS